MFLDRTGLSTTDITLVMFDCCSIIGSATTLRTKIWGSSATTLTVSSRRATCRTIESVWWPPASTETGKSTVSKPGRIAVTR